MKGFLFGLFSGQDQANVHTLTLQMGTDDWGSEGLQIAIFSLYQLQMETEEVWGTCWPRGTSSIITTRSRGNFRSSFSRTGKNSVFSLLSTDCFFKTSVRSSQSLLFLFNFEIQISSTSQNRPQFKQIQNFVNGFQRENRKWQYGTSFQQPDAV